MIHSKWKVSTEESQSRAIPNSLTGVHHTRSCRVSSSCWLPDSGIVLYAHTRCLQGSLYNYQTRAVLDASAPSSTDVSLNDCLLAGPSLYPKLIDILTSFRCHRIAFSVDTSKIREIVLHQEDKDLYYYQHRDVTSSGMCFSYCCAAPFIGPNLRTELRHRGLGWEEASNSLKI